MSIPNNDSTKTAGARIVNSRIALKIDTWEAWQAEAAQNLVLHAGEVAFVQVGTVPPVSYSNDTKGTLTEGVHLNKEPNQVLFKVGDGVTAFKDLVWGSAKAADVYDWAKVSSANIVEISYGSGKDEKKSTLSNFLKAFEEYKTSNDQAIADLTKATTDTNESTSLASRLTVVEGLVGGNADFATNTDVANAVKAAKEELVGTSTGTGVVSTITAASAQAIAAQSTADEAKNWINTNKINLEKVSKDPITGTEVTQAISDHNTNVKHITVDEMNKAISDADTALENALKGTSTSSTAATTIAGASDKAEAAATAADAAQGTADEALEKANTLIGSDTGKSARTIANEELAAQLIPTTAKEALNTLQEIAAWIQSHPEDATKFNSLLSGLGTITTGEGESATTRDKTVKEYVDGAVSGEATARNTAIASAIEGLAVDEITVGAGKTLASIKQEDGKIAATAVDIEITKSQISDFDDADYATADHDHDGDYADKTATETHISTEDIHVTADQKTSWTTGATKAGTAIQGVKVNGSELTIDDNKKVNIKIETGANNGNIKVNDVDVAVKGLGTAAYTSADAYASSTDFSTHVTKAVTTETYLLIDCGSSTVNVD